MLENEIPGERSLMEGLLYYIGIVLRYKALIITVTILAAVLVLTFSIVSLKLPPDKSPLPNRYRAYAVVIFQAGGGSAAGMSSMLSAFGMEAPTGSGSSQAQLALQILRSRAFMDEIVEKFNIIEKYEIEKNEKSRSRAVIQDNSEYNYDRDSGAMTIAFTSIDPKFSADVVNYMVNLLEEWIRREGVTARSMQLSRMRETLDELADEISGIESDIEVFQSEHGALDIMEIAASQATMLTELQTMLNAVELEISDYSEYSTFEDPALARLKNRRDNILQQISRIESGYISSDGRKMPSITEMPRLSLDFAHMQANLQLKTQLYQTLSELYEVTRLTADEAGMFSILEFAEIPDEKVEPSRGRLCMMVTFGAFAGSIALALFLNMFKKAKKDLAQKQIEKEEET